MIPAASAVIPPQNRTSRTSTDAFQVALEHRQPSLGHEERVRRERAVEVALDRLDVLQKVSAACCNAERALQHRPCRQYHPDARCALDETLRDAATRLASRQEGD